MFLSIVGILEAAWNSWHFIKLYSPGEQVISDQNVRPGHQDLYFHDKAVNRFIFNSPQPVHFASKKFGMDTSCQ
jgi:hypothetical protein